MKSTPSGYELVKNKFSVGNSGSIYQKQYHGTSASELLKDQEMIGYIIRKKKKKDQMSLPQEYTHQGNLYISGRDDNSGAGLVKVEEGGGARDFYFPIRDETRFGRKDDDSNNNEKEEKEKNIPELES